MTILKVKRLVSGLSFLLQGFCVAWFFARRILLIYFTLRNWGIVEEPIQIIWETCYEMVWLGLIPFFIFAQTRQFLHGILDKRLFTESNCRLAGHLLVLISSLPLLSITADLMFNHKPYSHWTLLIENYMLPYIDDVLLIGILAVLVFVLKNGRALKDDVDGFI